VPHVTRQRQRWKEKFGDWFREILTTAKIIDYRYPIKGCGVWLPYGFQLRKYILEVIRHYLDTTNHDETLFPTLIPEDLIAKESSHIHSFENEAYWITHGGKNPLGIKLALRPTSETAITPMAKLWIRSHADLPLKLYQIGSIFRYETKATRPLIRVREVSTFKEAHTFHATHQDAKAQVNAANEIYQNIFDSLAIPYVITERPSWDRFAGALATYAFDTIFPDGRCLQIGTTHNLGQNFSKAFNVTFETPEGTQAHVWQTSYGISERAVAATIALHGDDRGLLLPPSVAPIQVVIIPILFKGTQEQIMMECQEIHAHLVKQGIRSHIDDRAKMTPGAKYYEWEAKGVPVRIEIGPRDIKQGKVTVVRRNLSKRVIYRRESLSINDTLSEIDACLRAQAQEWMQAQIHSVTSLDEARCILNSTGGIVESPWCGEEPCGRQMETVVDVRVLGQPLELKKEKIVGTCTSCGKPATAILRLARTY
jgi:prolyl-tRNA synthetase